VPLSEDEQRILQEIEQQLYASDPELAREVSSTTVYRHAGRNLKWAALGFAAGVVLMVVSLWKFGSYQVLGAFAGFLVMLAAALLFQRNLYKIGRAGRQQWLESMRASGVKDYFGSASRRVRDRFKRAA
jgi:cell division protein FtsW (lipid II flippase)